MRKNIKSKKLKNFNKSVKIVHDANVAKEVECLSLQKVNENFQSMQLEVFSKLEFLDSHNEPIYRFFSEEWQANALCQGNVWITTLEACRAYENPLQGDPEEATHTYKSGHIFGAGTNPNFVRMAARLGIHIDRSCLNVNIINSKSIQKLPDAFVLCATTEFIPEKLSDTFGKYCVKISNPIEFFKKISIDINKKLEIQKGVVGLVRYRNRIYTGLEDSPGPIGFVKPSDEYSSQKEFRLLWLPKKFPISPFLLKCQSVTELCSRVL